MDAMDRKMVHVAVAIIENDQHELLITQRLPGTPKAGLWGFPGGKIETSETAHDAVIRECQEEIDLTLKHITQLIRYIYHYETYSVDLNVWYCNNYTGTAHGKEGQAIAWQSLTQIRNTPFLDAGETILSALSL